MNPPLTARLLVGFAAVLASGGLAVVACSDGDATPATKTDASVADVGTSDVQTATDTGTACPESPPKSCTAKGCTTQLGEPAVCVKNACVKLKSTECPTVAGPYDDDNAIVVAAFQDVYGTRKTTGVGRMNSHELAVTEINGRGGIRRKDRCAAARPVVMVGCNDSNFNPDGTAWVAPASDGGTALNPQQRAIDHIAGELDVQVLVGATTSGSALALNNYLQPKYKRLFITSSATSPDLEKPATFNASPDGTRLFWRTTANAKGQTSAMKTVLPQLADKVRQKYSTQTVKVAVLAKNDSFGQGTADALESGLQINGAPAGGANVNANYIRLNYREIPGKGAANQVEQSDALASLVAFVPDIIITIGTEEIVAGTATVPGDARNTGFLKPYEDAVRASGARKPFYIHSQANLTATFQAYVDLVSNFGDLAGRKDYLERTRGTNISEPTALARSFFSRFSSSYQTPTSLLFGMAEAYDAVYVSAYLHAATDTEAAPTALQLARAFPALVEGATSVDVGPGTFTSANQLLISGQKVNYNGAAGPLDWDYTNGEAPFDVNVWCVQINGQTGKSFFQQSAGQVWRYGTGNLEGAYNCPQD